MTSVLNLRLPLSGNKIKLWLVAAIICGASCSPRVKQTSQLHNYSQPQSAEKPAVIKPAAPVKPPAPKVSNIAMIMPYNLQDLNAPHGYSKSALKQAYMGVAFYQGFKLALDSLTTEGYSYKLQLIDGRDDPATARNLAVSPRIRNSQLVIGPVFPESISAFSVATNKKKLMVSPLSPTSPANYNNPSLITVSPPLVYHAKRLAQYAVSKLKAKKIFILKSGFSEDNRYVVPFKQAVDSLTKLHVKVIPFTVVRGNLSPLLPQLSKTENNIFLLPSVNQAFLQVTLRSLDTLSKNYPVILIGHPSWEDLSFLRAEQLQRLKTFITSADHVNYKTEETKDFIRAYRKAYRIEPDIYAIKGFDEGMYFGRLSAQSENGLIRPEQVNFEGLSNNFHFIRKLGLGLINTHVFVLKYVNYELRVVE